MPVASGMGRENKGLVIGNLNKSLIFVFTIAAGNCVSLPLSHLVPEDSALARLVPQEYQLYSEHYLQSLAPVIDRSARVFAIETETPFPETIIGLKQTGDRLDIFGAQPSGPTFSSIVPLPPPPLKLLGTDGKVHIEAMPAVQQKTPAYHLNLCNAQIDQKLAQRIVQAWDSVLLETRPDAGQPMIGADGAILHFASSMRYRVVTGIALGVGQDSRPAMLGRIAHDLTAICWKWSAPVKDAIPPAVELEQTLKQLEAPASVKSSDFDVRKFITMRFWKEILLNPSFDRTAQ